MKTSPPPPETARKPRKLETPEERQDRLKLEAEKRSHDRAAEEAEVDRMIRRNIELHGP